MPDKPTKKLIAGQQVILPSVILVILLAITFFAGAYTKNSVERTARTQFEERVDDNIGHIQSALGFYIDNLYGAQGFYETDPPQNHSEFSAYFSRLIKPDLHPGILAMAFLERVKAEDLSAFVEGVRNGGYSEFKISPPGERPEYYIIKYNEPRIGTKEALGADVYALPGRQKAIEIARDSGQVAATPKVKLIASGENRPGVVFFIPVYKAGLPRETLEERRKAIVGEINAVILSEKLFGGIFADTQNMALEVFDGTEETKDNLFYDSDEGVNAFNAYKPRFAVEKELKIADRIWTLRFYTLAGFHLSLFAELAPAFTLVIGTLLSLLIAFIVYMLGATKERVSLAAKGMTKELRLANESLTDRAEELTQKNKIIETQVRSLEESKKAMLNLLQDIKQSEEEYYHLAKELEKFKLAVDNVSDQIVITDPGGTVIYANKAIEKITGYKPEEAIGKKSGSLWKLPMPMGYYQKMWDTIDKDNKKVFTSEIQNRRKNGVIYTAAISIAPVLDEKGNVMFFVGIERDITKEKAIDRAKSEFVSLAAHQLRTPLTGIEWTARLFSRKEKLSEMGKKYLEDIMFSVQRLNALVKLFLNATRVEGGQMQIKPQSIEVVNFINEFVANYASFCERKQLTLSFQEHPEKLVAVTDDNLLEQVTHNLIDNAIDYTPSGGKIDIALEVNGDDFIFRVQDTGIGIPEKEQAAIFERFKRASNALKTKPDGNGLGLYVAAQAVKLLGGEIGFQSKEGAGSTFFVKIPLQFRPKNDGESPMS